MENVRCALCGADDTNIICKTRDRNWRLPGEFNVARCKVCGLVYINPRPSSDEIGSYYPETFMARSRMFQGDIENMKMHGMPWKQVMGQLAKPLLEIKKNGGRSLDIGSGDGLFCAYMKSAGWDAYGVEPRTEAAEASARQFGITVVPGYLENAGFENDFFDAVTMNNVFEHVANPVELLDSVRRILKSDGALMIDVPNYDGLESRLFGDRWVALDAPRHLYHYNKKTLTGMLEKAGFSVLKMINDNDAGAYKMGYAESVRHVIADTGIRKYPDKVKKADEARPAASAPSKSGGPKNALKNVFHKTEQLVYTAVGEAAKLVGAGGRLIAVSKKIR